MKRAPALVPRRELAAALHRVLQAIGNGVLLAETPRDFALVRYLVGAIAALERSR
jgi:hypothetical protein